MTSEQRQAWFQERKLGIGSSDAAAVAGKSPWKSPYEVWADKLGILPESAPTAPMRWGLQLEEAIATAYEEETGLELMAPPMAQSKTHKFMLASCDRVPVAAQIPRRIVELKNVGPFAGKEWGRPGSDEVPDHYLIQVQHQMAVLEADVADIAALFGGNDFRIYTVRRDDELIESLVGIEAAFWHYVVTKTQPPIDWELPHVLELMKRLYKGDGPPVDVTDEDVLEELASYLGWGQEEKAAKIAKDQCQARLIERMGNAYQARLPDGTVISRPLVANPGYTVKPFKFRSFKIRKGTCNGNSVNCSTGATEPVES